VKGRLLGVDFGMKRVGFAITDPDRIIASPLETYERQDAESDAAHYKSLIAREQIVAIVVGLPMHNDGREGKSAELARAFGQMLNSVTSLPVHYWDERFSTVQAEAALWSAGLTHRKRAERRDRVAAQMILQSYMEAGCPH
jgi:putative Holliday junction resolvase